MGGNGRSIPFGWGLSSWEIRRLLSAYFSKLGSQQRRKHSPAPSIRQVVPPCSPRGLLSELLALLCGWSPPGCRAHLCPGCRVLIFSVSRQLFRAHFLLPCPRPHVLQGQFSLHSYMLLFLPILLTIRQSPSFQSSLTCGLLTFCPHPLAPGSALTSSLCPLPLCPLLGPGSSPGLCFPRQLPLATVPCLSHSCCIHH